MWCIRLPSSGLSESTRRNDPSIMFDSICADKGTRKFSWSRRRTPRTISDKPARSRTMRRSRFCVVYRKRHNNPLAHSPAHNRLPLERSVYVIIQTEVMVERVRQADLTKCSFSSRFQYAFISRRRCTANPVVPRLNSGSRNAKQTSQ